MSLVNCLECGKEVSNQAAACPHCGNPLPAPRPRTRNSFFARNKAGEFSTGAGCVLLLVLVGAPIGLAGWCAESTGDTPSAPAPASCSSRTCVVRAPTSGDSFVLAVTKESLNEMMSSGTDRAIAVMVLNGSAFLVPQNTSVSIVDRGFGVRKVLVLDGPMVGRTGWTVADWVVDR